MEIDKVKQSFSSNVKKNVGRRNVIKQFKIKNNKTRMIEFIYYGEKYCPFNPNTNRTKNYHVTHRE